MNSGIGRAVEAAIEIAVRAHRGQVDKGGQPYVLHPLRLMFAVGGPIAQQAAVLHDVVEDTPTTFQDIEDAGVSLEAIEALRLLTHDLKESYADYIVRLKANAVAREVKLADLQDNYRLDRVAYRESSAEEDARRIQKYILTRMYLADEIEEVEYRRRMLIIDPA